MLLASTEQKLIPKMNLPESELKCASFNGSFEWEFIEVCYIFEDFPEVEDFLRQAFDIKCRRVIC